MGSLHTPETSYVVLTSSDVRSRYQMYIYSLRPCPSVRQNLAQGICALGFLDIPLSPLLPKKCNAINHEPVQNLAKYRAHPVSRHAAGGAPSLLLK